MWNSPEDSQEFLQRQITWVRFLSRLWAHPWAREGSWREPTCTYAGRDLCGASFRKQSQGTDWDPSYVIKNAEQTLTFLLEERANAHTSWKRLPEASLVCKNLSWTYWYKYTLTLIPPLHLGWWTLLRNTILLWISVAPPTASVAHRRPLCFPSILTISWVEVTIPKGPLSKCLFSWAGVSRRKWGWWLTGRRWANECWAQKSRKVVWIKLVHKEGWWELVQLMKLTSSLIRKEEESPVGNLPTETQRCYVREEETLGSSEGWLRSCMSFHSQNKSCIFM